MKTLMTVCAIVVAITATSLASIGGGFTSGPDDSVDIDFFFENSSLSTSDVTSLSIDGSTADAYTVIWDDYWGLIAPAGATVNVTGLDTSLLTLTFIDNPDGFNPGESMKIELDPDKIGDPSFGAIISDMIGVEVLFDFRDGSSWLGTFVDDPDPGAGLILVPEPVTVVLLGIGCLALRIKSKRISSKQYRK
jgi:hypothetical protein